MKVVTGKKEFFPELEKLIMKVPQSDNPLAYRWYDENKMVAENR
jgi:xylose isomerase